MIQISDQLHEKLYGDEAILEKLERARVAFLEGDKSALFFVIMCCAQYQAIIPDWATDEILKIEQLIETGELKDFNAAFGWDGENKATRKKRARLKMHTNSVLGLLQKYRLEGDSLNADDLLQKVADELEISRRDVENIYKQSGKFIKNLPRGNPENGNFAFSHTTLTSHRRHGRPILKD